MKTLRNEGLFTPPSFEGSIQLPGHNGGANFQRPRSIRPAASSTCSQGAANCVRIALPAAPGAGRGGGGGGGGGAVAAGGPIITPEQKAELMADAKALVDAAKAKGGWCSSPRPTSS